MAQAYDSGGGPISDELVRKLEALAEQMRASRGQGKKEHGEAENADPNAASTQPLADVVGMWRHRINAERRRLEQTRRHASVPTEDPPPQQLPPETDPQ